MKKNEKGSSVLFTATFIEINLECAAFPMNSCGFVGGFSESEQHIIDGFSVMKRIANMYPNILYKGESIQAELENWTILNIIKKTKERRKFLTF